MKHWNRRQMIALLALLPALAAGAQAEEKVGIVLMHGKNGSPEHVKSLSDDLVAAGYLVVTPDMPWSRARGYDRTLEEAHVEIDVWVEALRQMGAARIAVGGHSMGANMAMGYAATHPGLAAVMAIGPGQTVEASKFRDALGSSLAQAKALVAEGRGGEPVAFSDLHLGKVIQANTTPRAYASYFDPAGLASMPAIAPRIDAPFLWVVGTRDKNMLERGRAYAFDRVPAKPANRYAEVDADHMGTPDAARRVVVEWLRGVL